MVFYSIKETFKIILIASDASNYVTFFTRPGLLEAEPFLELERISEQGTRFHKIIRQQLSGIPESSIDLSICDDEVLQFWWSEF